MTWLSLWHRLSPFALGTTAQAAMPGSLCTVTGEPTGFRNQNAVVITADHGGRTVTLTGDTECYYRGRLVSEVVPGWTSPVHAANSAVNLFLVYNGTTFSWNTSIGSDMVICQAVSNGSTVIFYMRESHGLVMDSSTHWHLHTTIGTYRKSGGGLPVGIISAKGRKMTAIRNANHLGAQLMGWFANLFRRTDIPHRAAVISIVETVKAQGLDNPCAHIAGRIVRYWRKRGLLSSRVCTVCWNIGWALCEAVVLAVLLPRRIYTAWAGRRAPLSPW